jgi:hypothetical protein
MYIAEPGDILLYHKLLTLEVREINLIQRLKTGPQSKFYYHSAIALDSKTLIESDGKRVVVNEILQGGFDAFRPPIPLEGRLAGIAYIRSLVGQKYDWLVVLDDVLRAFTHDLVHLPVRLVKNEERHRKICSTIVVTYLDGAGWKTALNRNSLPEDIYLALESYQVDME